MGPLKLPLIIPTPLQQIPSVTLTPVTWNNHIVSGHPEMAGKIDRVETVVSAPSTVFISGNNPKYLGFINNDVKTRKGALLTVFICPAKKEVITAYYNSGYKSTKQVSLPDETIWVQE